MLMKYNVHSLRGRKAINPSCASQSDSSDWETLVERVSAIFACLKKIIR